MAKAEDRLTRAQAAAQLVAAVLATAPLTLVPALAMPLSCLTTVRCFWRI